MHPTIMGNPMFEVPQEPFQCQEHQEAMEERQIAVDPFSLRQLSQLDIDKPLPIPSVSVDDVVPVRRPRLGSSSLRCSAEASPRLPTGPVPPARPGELSQRRFFAEGQPEMAADEFDVILSSSERRPSAPQRWGSNVPLIEGSAAVGSGCYDVDAVARKGGRRKARGGEAFMCCMYLPGLSRRSKPVQVRPSNTFRTAECDPGPGRPSTASQAVSVSLERFECASWSASSGVGLDGGSAYFDLPLELIQSCDDETDMPVCAAFLFDGDGVRRSVLKKRVAAARPSSGKASADSSGGTSSRRVRFSMVSGTASTSSCPPSPAALSVSPRLRKTREEFDAFLGAQGT